VQHLHFLSYADIYRMSRVPNLKSDKARPKFGCHGNVPWRIEKLIWDRLSTVVVPVNFVKIGPVDVEIIGPTEIAKNKKRRQNISPPSAAAGRQTTCYPAISLLWVFFYLFTYLPVCLSISCAFSALTLLVGRQEEHPACKNWVMRSWWGYLSGARCRLFAYGPADATAVPKPHRLLPHWNPDCFYLSGTGLPRLPWRRGH